MSPQVIGVDEQDAEPVDVEYWAALAAASLADQGVTSPEAELNLIFVDEDEMAALNGEHMQHQGPTDVLSFPLELPEPLDAAGPSLLGDIVVCPSVARRNAPTHAGSYDDELALLVVHGVLHILGHDHAEPDEETAMQAIERDLLSRYHDR